MRRGIYGREGEGGHLHPSVAERKTWEYKRRKPVDAGFLLIVGLLMVRPVIVYKVTAFIAFFIIFFRKFLINLILSAQMFSKNQVAL